LLHLLAAGPVIRLYLIGAFLIPLAFIAFGVVAIIYLKATLVGLWSMLIGAVLALVVWRLILPKLAHLAGLPDVSNDK
jgi:hypothetical protein